MPGPTTVETVRAIVGEQLGFVLRRGVLGPDDDLWNLGMTSLNCMGIMLALEDGFDLELPEHRLNEATFGTVRSIAAAVEEALAGQDATGGRDRVGG
ncbi:phosphopantetheine-binding protein [Streptomyces sp. CB03238]|uniref:phosphopantetheine-binding protein n=1 Tax=Streptomyces sp. CB03238 TaxID=1907777 RepID=UPI000A121D28|nr:phosphopantetheine-binding protein [Streptomyces sp. CB03238]ORT60866.1 hypothetical protein BKD26_06595 [Streptomyces sp. CB03238]